MRANFNMRRSMKAETSRQIPHKLATRLKFVFCQKLLKHAFACMFFTSRDLIILI